MVRQSIEQSGRHSFALEDLTPFAEGKIAGDQYAAAFVAVSEHLEEQFGAAPAEREVAQFVDHQQVGAIQLRQKTIDLEQLLFLFKQIDQSGGGKEPHAMSLSTRGGGH